MQTGNTFYSGAGPFHGKRLFRRVCNANGREARRDIRLLRLMRRPSDGLDDGATDHQGGLDWGEVGAYDLGWLLGRNWDPECGHK